MLARVNLLRYTNLALHCGFISDLLFKRCSANYGECQCADEVVFENLPSILLFSTAFPSYKSTTKLVESALVSPPGQALGDAAPPSPCSLAIPVDILPYLSILICSQISTCIAFPVKERKIMAYK